MQIVKTAWKWKSTPQKRRTTNYIILHHAAGNGSALDIDRIHKNKGWSGIGYHFYVRKDGSVYEGRPIDTVGAQCTGYNSVSMGICFEGNFENETMTNAQLKSGIEIASYCKGMYSNAKVVKHSDLFATACPGKNFPFSKIANGQAEKEITSVNDIVWELASRGIISDKALWLSKLETDKNAYWLAKKTVDYFRKAVV